MVMVLYSEESSKGALKSFFGRVNAIRKVVGKPTEDSLFSKLNKLKADTEKEGGDEEPLQASPDSPYVKAKKDGTRIYNSRRPPPPLTYTKKGSGGSGGGGGGSGGRRRIKTDEDDVMSDELKGPQGKRLTYDQFDIYGENDPDDQDIDEDDEDDETHIRRIQTRLSGGAFNEGEDGENEGVREEEDGEKEPGWMLEMDDPKAKPAKHTADADITPDVEYALNDNIDCGGYVIERDEEMDDVDQFLADVFTESSKTSDGTYHILLKTKKSERIKLPQARSLADLLLTLKAELPKKVTHPFAIEIAQKAWMVSIYMYIVYVKYSVFIVHVYMYIRSCV